MKVKQLGNHIRSYLLWIKILVSVLILIIIFYKIDFNVLYYVFMSISIGWYLIFIIITLLGIIIASYKWWKILLFENLQYSIRYILKVFWIGLFYNHFLPGRVGGDAIKVIYLLKRKKEKNSGYDYKASISVLIDRMYNMIGLLFIVYFSIVINYNLIKDYFFAPLLASLIILTIITILILSDRFFKNSNYPFINKIMRMLSVSREYINSYKKNIFMISWAIIYQLGVICANFLLGLALGIHVDFAYYMFFIPLLAFITLFPFTFGGLGIREASYIFFLKQVNITEEKALLMSFLMYFSLMITSLPGGILHVFEKNKLSSRQGDL